MRRSDPAEPGISRRGAGKGFTYTWPNGRRVGAATRSRIAKLAIPPAWKQVWICPDPDAHLLATGVDSAGRTQYLYHPHWREERDAEKFARAVRLASLLPGMRRRLDRDLQLALSTDTVTREAVEALALLLLDTGRLRLGSESYEEENGSHGAATLLVSHAHLHPGQVELVFPAKGGAQAQVRVPDGSLAQFVGRLKRGRRAGDHLMSFVQDGERRDLTSVMVGSRFQTLVGSDFSVKDLRTWAATVAAAEELACRTSYPDDRERRVKQAIEAAADTLGDTTTVARGSYVDPRLITDFLETGRTVRPVRGRPLEHSAQVRRRVERDLLALLAEHTDPVS